MVLNAIRKRPSHHVQKRNLVSPGANRPHHPRVKEDASPGTYFPPSPTHAPHDSGYLDFSLTWAPSVLATTSDHNVCEILVKRSRRGREREREATSVNNQKPFSSWGRQHRVSRSRLIKFPLYFVGRH